MSTTEVIYNGACPICSREVSTYREMGARAGADIRFTDLRDTDLARLGLDPDSAARRLHMVHEGRLISGFPAFLALWRELPRMRWLARLLGLPGLRQVAALGYDHIAAPLLYALHRRRQRRLHKPNRPG